MSKQQQYPASGDFKPSPDRKTTYQKPDEPVKFRPTYHVWNPDELKSVPAGSLKAEAKIPEGSEKTWPGGGSKGVVNRLPEASKKSLGISGDQTLK